MSTPADDFTKVVVLSCLQVRAWHTAQLQATPTPPHPHVSMMPLFVAERLLVQAARVGVDTAPLWQEFEEGLHDYTHHHG